MRLHESRSSCVVEAHSKRHRLQIGGQQAMPKSLVHPASLGCLNHSQKLLAYCFGLLLMAVRVTFGLKRVE